MRGNIKALSISDLQALIMDGIKWENFLEDLKEWHHDYPEIPIDHKRYPMYT
jgi:hypothetical protein